MDHNAAAQAYRTNEVSDASPVKSVAILYDKAIEALNNAIRAIEMGDINLRWKNNKKAIDIIYALDNCLDMEHGGEIAENLTRLYQFMIYHLVQVDLKNDPQPARDVIKLLEPLQQSWAELAQRDPAELQVESQKAMEEAKRRKATEEDQGTASDGSDKPKAAEGNAAGKAAPLSGYGRTGAKPADPASAPAAAPSPAASQGGYGRGPAAPYGGQPGSQPQSAPQRIVV